MNGVPNETWTHSGVKVGVTLKVLQSYPLEVLGFKLVLLKKHEALFNLLFL